MKRGKGSSHKYLLWAVLLASLIAFVLVSVSLHSLGSNDIKLRGFNLNMGTKLHHIMRDMNCTTVFRPKCHIYPYIRYWNFRFFPKDCYTSPLLGNSDASYADQKYVIFEPDIGGWNDQRMAAEVVILFAHTTGRTLVIPPSTLFTTYFDMTKLRDAMNIITMDTFINEVARRGLLRIPYPNISSDEYMKDSTTTTNGQLPTGDALFEYLQSACYTRLWDPSKYFIGFNITLDSRSGNHWYQYDAAAANSNSANKRLEGMQRNGRTVIPYDREMHTERAIYFPGRNISNRILANFYSFLYWEDLHVERLYRRIARDRIRYADELFCAAGKVVYLLHRDARFISPPIISSSSLSSLSAAEAVAVTRTKVSIQRRRRRRRRRRRATATTTTTTAGVANKLAVSGGSKQSKHSHTRILSNPDLSDSILTKKKRMTYGGDVHSNVTYFAYHIRRGDFQRLYKDSDVSGSRLWEDTKHLLDPTISTLIYVATDETDLSFFKPFFQPPYTVKFLHNYRKRASLDHVEARLHAHTSLTLEQQQAQEWKGLIDQIVCANAHTFIGTPFSTFTSYVTRLRGYYRDGRYEHTYFTLPMHMYELQQHREPDGSFWEREFETAHKDIDDIIDQDWADDRIDENVSKDQKKKKKGEDSNSVAVKMNGRHGNHRHSWVKRDHPAAPALEFLGNWSTSSKMVSCLDGITTTESTGFSPTTDNTSIAAHNSGASADISSSISSVDAICDLYPYVRYWNLHMHPADCYSSPLRPPPSAPWSDQKYLIFEEDAGGWNNKRINFETTVLLAYATGRTLVVPGRILLTPRVRGRNDNYDSYETFFNLASLRNVMNIVAMEEFITQVVKTGILQRKHAEFKTSSSSSALSTGRVDVPVPQNLSEEGNKIELYAYLKAHSHEQEWDTQKHFMVFNLSHTYPNNKIGDYSILLEESAAVDAGSREAIYHRHLSRREQTREDLTRFLRMLTRDRTPIAYNETLHRPFALYFQGTDPSYRLLANFYTYIYSADFHTEQIFKRFIRDRLHYREDIFCAAGRVVRQLHLDAAGLTGKHIQDSIQDKDESGKHADAHTLGGNTNYDATYHAFHIRRDDFQRLYSITNASGDQIWADSHHLLSVGASPVIYIASDEKDRAFFRSFMQPPWTIRFLSDYLEAADLRGVHPNKIGLIEQIVCANAHTFVGTLYSTFSAYITRLRGYYRDGRYQRTYYTQREEMYVLWKRRYLDGSFWEREYEKAHVDIDDYYGDGNDDDGKEGIENQT